MKKFLVSWLSCFTVMFVLAGIFNSLIISDFVAENVSGAFLRTPPSLTSIAIGYALLAILMTLIYPRVFESSTYSLKTGVLFGMVVGIFWLLPYSLVLHGVYNFPALGLLIDPAWALVEQGLGGAAIGLAYSRLS